MPEFASVVIHGERELAAAFRDIQRRTDRATMYAVREAGRRTKRAAMAGALVYRGKDAITRKAHRETGNPDNRPVKGLLRSSIHSSRRLIREAASYGVRVAPRGNRVHLYSQRIEVLTGYMRNAYDSVAPQLAEIAARAWARSTRK